VKLRRPTETGTPATVRYASRKRRNEMADSGSRSSIGLVEGATYSTAAAWVPSPILTRAKSSWFARRSQTRGPLAMDHSQDGSGLFHTTARRCWSAFFLASLRSCAM
jgi:hypothetical protein